MKLAAVIILLGLTGCAVTDVAPQGLMPADEMVTAPTAPLTRDQATRIASDYFHTFFGDCGGMTPEGETPDAWLFSTVIGFSADPGPKIRVAKSGATVSATGYATVYWSDGKWRYDATRYRTFFGPDADASPPSSG